jgi:hypothetical protein
MFHTATIKEINADILEVRQKVEHKYHAGCSMCIFIYFFEANMPCLVAIQLYKKYFSSIISLLVIILNIIIL